MKNNIPKNSLWHLITIDDAPRFLLGESIYCALKLIQEVEEIKFVILNYIEGAGKEKLIHSLQNQKNQITDIKDLMEKFFDVSHVEWGDFFLFKEYPKEWENLEDEEYPNAISLTDVTLRAVDNQYMYIYTRSERVVEALKSQYTIESVKNDLLENLDYPD